MKSNTALRMKEAMEINDVNQAELAKRTGISKGALSSYLSGRYIPKQNNTFLIAKALNVSEAWLMGADVPMEASPSGTPASADTKSRAKSKGVTINVLGRVAAGIPIEAIEDVIDTEEIPEELARTGEFFGLRIKGDSMEPDIHNNDTVIVRRQDDAESDEIVIALINGDDGVCKRLKKYQDSIALISNNPNYAPRYFSTEEVSEKPVRIVGKVVELRRKF